MDQLRRIIARETKGEDCPSAARIESGVPIYDCNALTEASPKDLRAELAAVLLTGPGVFVLKGAFADTQPVDDATAAFEAIIAREKAEGLGGGDHFAKAGTNDRIWNSLEKLALEAPETFARYHANPWIALAASAWLGPVWQMTAQVNLVHPGGAAQAGHCDYHLGFMGADQANAYPDHVHEMSARLTLQGAMAHCDMPVESGTTKLLPHSQNWPQNYRRFHDDDVRDLFEANCVQLPLVKGDALFFSPGLLHAAGENRSADIHRMANLLQVSSPFGRAMETVDRRAICRAVYPHLANLSFTGPERKALLTTMADGYPFPTDLDRDPPQHGLAPPSQRDVLATALQEGWTVTALDEALAEHAAKRAMI